MVDCSLLRPGEQIDVPRVEGDFSVEERGQKVEPRGFGEILALTSIGVSRGT